MVESGARILLHNLSFLAGTAAGVGVVLALLHWLERFTGRCVSRRLGWRAVVLTGWLGVPLHELAHLAAAKLFGHRIIAWKLFDPDPASGTLGYVRHGHSRRTLWQIQGCFFIGMAPVLAGGGALTLLLGWILPPHAAADLGSELGQLMGGAVAADLLSARLWLRLLGLAADCGAAIWRERSAWLPLQVYLCICVASHLAPSRSDLRCAGSGAVAAALLAVLIAGAASLAGLSLAAAPALLLLLTLLVAAVAISSGLHVAGAVLLGRGRSRAGRATHTRLPPRTLAR